MPESAVYEVVLDVEHDIEGFSHVISGEVHIEGDSKSFARRMIEVVTQVLIRESGF